MKRSGDRALIVANRTVELIGTPKGSLPNESFPSKVDSPHT